MSSFIEYGPLTKSSSFTLGNLSVKNLRKAWASATGFGVSAPITGGMAVSSSTASARAPEVEWIAARTVTLQCLARHTSLNLCRRRVAGTLVVDPGDICTHPRMQSDWATRGGVPSAALLSLDSLNSSGPTYW